MTQLNKDAQKFVAAVLTEVEGKRPSERTIRTTAARIARALEPVAAREVSAPAQAQRRRSR